MLGWLVDKIIILSFWVSLSKNKNIDHQVKETYAIISTQVTCETNHIFTHDSTNSNALIFRYFIVI